ncbi:Tim44/TimA family putative adaptor protein [Pseudogemmobacter sp. W21_MBD1_M6]|uniref:Tim44/TimA family putative adaptor protein n=1 Tax=Pseudogemmobacter sp. W21_MBD1_M6 TaxID=3240271 RepID=UPI003F951541
MSSAVVQLLVLAGIAIFLILRLKNVLGTREGFEKPPVVKDKDEASSRGGRRDFEVIEGGPDRDITDHAAEGSNAEKALTKMKAVDPSFNVGSFLEGARGAYEMILMAFERGDLAAIKPFLSEDVYDTFAEVVADREMRGLTIKTEFIGIRELALSDADFDSTTFEAEITVKFVAELTTVVRNAEGEIVEGNPNAIKRQKDVWTFARQMGTNDPNWQLVATGG